MPAQGEKAFEQFLQIDLRLSHRRRIFPWPGHWPSSFTANGTDTVYLALAQLNHCDFWTADEKLYNAVRHALPWVKWIGEDTPTINHPAAQ